LLYALYILSTSAEKPDEKRFGLNHSAILGAIPQFSDENLAQIIKKAENNPINLEETFTESDSITEMSDRDRKKYREQIRYANQVMRGQAYRETQDNLNEIPPNALIYLLKAIRGDQGITLRQQGEN
jgi:hypothetical protein